MPRPAAVPLGSNLVTGRSARRSTTPPSKARLGIEHPHHMLVVVGPVGASRHTLAGSEATRREGREGWGDQPAP